MNVGGSSGAPADRFALVALDMNGTTIRDGGVFQAALEHAFAAVGIPLPPDEDVTPFRGMSKSEMFARLIPDPGLASAAHADFTDAFLAAVASGAVRPIDGAHVALERLHDLGLLTCLITGFSPELQRAIIDELGWTKLVDFTVSSEDVANGRPHPDLLEHAARIAGITDLARLVVAGDTVNDLLAAESAGAGLIVGVLSGSHGRAQLEQVAAARLIDDVGALPELVVEACASAAASGE